MEKVTKDTIAAGGVLAMLYFDLHARTKELVQEIGTGFANDLISKPGVVFAYSEIDEPIGGGEGKNWSTSMSCKILTKNLSSLAAICMAHSPFSIEILRPDEIRLPLSDAHDLLSTISAASAEYKRYILTKVADKSELGTINENLKKRAEMGKQMLSRKKG